jgi:hypothetical protein
MGNLPVHGVQTGFTPIRSSNIHSRLAACVAGTRRGYNLAGSLDMRAFYAAFKIQIRTETDR